MLKLSVLFGDAPTMDPAKVAPGFEMCEVPAGLLVDACLTDEEWAKRKAELQSYPLPPIRVASHWLDKPCTTPQADWELLEFWTKRVLRRLSELGVELAGVYGLFFPRVEGYSETRQMDQAIRYANMLGDVARANGMTIVLEPMANPCTWFPSYKEGIAFARRVDHPNVKLMADLNYFLKLDEPLEDIALDPELCLHGHMAGDNAQPGIGGLEPVHRKFFSVLRDIGYERGVSAACPWLSTGEGEFDLTRETAKTLAYMQRLRAEVYGL